MDTDAARLRILLAEDDPVSRDFLEAALSACGAAVTPCADGHGALLLARSGVWDVLLLDHRLPDITGIEILAALRADPGRQPSRPVAIATTAAPADDSEVLRRAGFAEVLPKPISTASLRAALQRHCRTPATLLNDQAAAYICGSPEAVTRLRRLLAERELPAILAAVDRCNGDFRGLLPVLHRLRAACGFCGAPGLAAAGEALERELRQGTPAAVAGALAEFRDSVRETRELLRDMPDATG